MMKNGKSNISPIVEHEILPHAICLRIFHNFYNTRSP